jgi:hypothetical protein
LTCFFYKIFRKFKNNKKQRKSGFDFSPKPPLTIFSSPLPAGSTISSHSPLAYSHTLSFPPLASQSLFLPLG